MQVGSHTSRHAALAAASSQDEMLALHVPLWKRLPVPQTGNRTGPLTGPGFYVCCADDARPPPCDAHWMTRGFVAEKIRSPRFFDNTRSRARPLKKPS